MHSRSGDETPRIVAGVDGFESSRAASTDLTVTLARYGSRTSRAFALPCSTSEMASLTWASGLVS